MAPILIATKNNGVVVPAFRERGAADLMPGAVSDCPIIAMPTSDSSELYEAYISEISAIAVAQLDNRVHFESGPAVVLKRVPSYFYFERPNASFIIDASEEQRTALAGMGLVEEPGRRNVFVGCPEAENIAAIFAMGPVDGRIHPGTCTADAYLAYVYSLKAMTLFQFASSCIMAGRVNLRVSPTYGNADIANDEAYKYLRADNTVLEVNNKNLRLGAGYKLGTTGYVLKGFVPFDNSQAIPDGTINHTRKINGSGLFFPYFAGQVLPDKSILVDVFETTFLNCLAESPENRLRIWSSIRPGLRNLALFRAGQAISHAFMGIKLAKMGRCGLRYVVVNHQYQGFVLQGSYQIGLFGSVWSPVEQVTLQADIDSLNKHAKALGEILGIINAVCREDGTNVYSFSITDINSSRKLANTLHSIDYNLFTSTNWRDDLKDLFGKLEFGDHYPVPTVPMVMAFLDFVANGNLGSLQNYPFMISDRILTEKDRVSFGLAMFGPKCPSLNYGVKGRNFTIPRPNHQDPNLIEDASGKRALQYLPLKFQSYAQAVSEWRRLFTTGTFTIPDASKKGGSQFTDNRLVNLQISANNFAPAYGLIKMIVEAHRGDATAGQKKRKADGEVKGSAKKSRQDAMDMSGLL